MDRNLYDKQTVMVPKKSGFDKSHQNLFTSKVGTITPIMVDEVVPNTTIDLQAAITAQLPPLAADTFMRCKLKYAAFFVPTRLLMKDYESYATNYDGYLRAPIIQFNGSATTANKLKYLKAGTLADYLGFKATDEAIENSLGTNAVTISLNALPFMAYHKIYDDWFRNTLVQRGIFLTPSERNSLAQANRSWFNCSHLDYVAPTSNGGYVINPETATMNANGSPIYGDGTHIMDLRQANFDIDLFTSCQPSAQNGTAASVDIDWNDVDAEGSFTISALRAANSLQQFMERNNIAGNRLVDYVKANYNANLSDGVAQRSILLGSGAFDVYSKGIYATAGWDTDAAVSTRNPFECVGSKYGSAVADGSDSLINNFTAQEAGYIFVVAWLSPKVTYSSGIAPYLTRYVKKTPQQAQTEMANPTLQNVGNEAVYQSYINDKLLDDKHSTEVFGYNDRYCTWKDKTDELHGLLRDGKSLSAFASQRTISDSGSTSISSDFLKIPTDYLDGVAAVEGDISEYGYWADTFFKYRVSMPLARYSTPSLQNPAEEHGDAVTIAKGGKHLA